MKTPLLLAFVLAFGATGIGVAISVLRDLKDRTFRTGEDIERQLKSDFIGMIPILRPNSSGIGSTLVTANAGDGRRVLQNNNVYREFMASPTSAFAEAIGRVKFAILRQTGEGRIVGFTSVLPDEGASTIAIAVAQSLAKSGRSVILVDCDLRHPELTRELSPNAKVGLQEILINGDALEEAIYWDASSGFAFLPGVLQGLKARPEELLETPALLDVLKVLRQRYDYVIVDLPPMFPMLDVSMTDRFIESYIVVVEWGSSRVDTVVHALARCPGVQRRMLGFVLNKVDFNRLRHYDQSAADYYDARRYSNYVLQGPQRQPHH
jgi:succinoglycan biosynthesis transport protein ExoP